MIDVAEKTIEKRQGPYSFDFGSPTEARFCALETVEAPDVGTGTPGTGGSHSSTVFRKSWFGFVINQTCCHECHTARGL